MSQKVTDDPSQHIVNQEAKLIPSPPIFAEKPFPRIIRWFRGIGVASIFLGAGGLMATFFWFAVVAIYVGMSVILLDLWFENLGLRTKTAASLVILLSCAYFTKSVVFHTTPLSLRVAIIDDMKEIIIGNGSLDDDYVNFDVVMIPDRRDEVFVESATLMDNYPTCAFVDQPNVIENNHEAKMFRFNGKSWESRSSVVRMRCQTFAKRSVIRVSVKLCKSANGSNSPVTATGDRPKIEGTFTSRFRVRTVNF